MDQKSDDEFPLIGKFTEQDVWTKTGRKKYTSRRKEFSGWGSAKLIDFLRSIGRNVDKPISQDEVYDIIHSYIHENKLRHPQKKKKVICDENLRLLFGRKSFNRLRISGLLESHFAENQKTDNGSPDVSEDEDATVACNRPQRSRSEAKTHISGLNELKEKVSEARKNCFASITANNIKLVYLRRSLVEEFLKNLETFENKVMDCFVRVKSDPNGFYLPKTYFQLVQITGIKRASECYKTGEISTDIVLKVSNLMKDIRICMVSDDDFSEEECEDLRYRVKEGHIKRPTVGELDEKAKIIHEDLTNHWIDREIVMLQNRIDRANEKGWRRELFEYIERKELLQTPSERLRLLKEPPKVAAEEETEREDPTNSPTDAERVNEGNEASANDMDQEVSANLMVEERENEGNGPVSHHSVDLARNGAVSLHNMNVMLDLAGNGGVSHQNPRKRGRPKGNRAASKKRAAEIEGEGKTGTEDSISSIYSFFFGNGTASGEKVVERETEGKVAVSIVPRQLDFGDEDAIIEKAAEREDEGIGAASRSPTVSRQQDSGIGAAFIVSRLQQDSEEPQHQQSAEIKDTAREKDVIHLDEEDEDPDDAAGGTKKANASIPVIDIDDDDDDADPHVVTKTAVPESTQSTPSAVTGEERKQAVVSCDMWHYVDPSGETQGPFPMSALKAWREAGYFDAHFKVWEVGQCQKDAVLLTDAIRLMASQG